MDLSSVRVALLNIARVSRQLLVLFIVLVSLGVNVYFFLTIDDQRVTGDEAGRGGVGLQSLPDLRRGPTAYGSIDLTELFTPQAVPRGIAPARSVQYAIGSGVTLELPPTLLIYRDQGVDLGSDVLASLQSKLGISLEGAAARWYLRRFDLRSADGSTVGSVDIDARSLTLERSMSKQESVVGQSMADDVECIALARALLTSFGIDASSLTPSPRVVDRETASKTIETTVVWDASIDGVPLLDANLQPVAAAAVRVSRKERTADRAMLSLINPEQLSRSPYSVAPMDRITAALTHGGMKPLQLNDKSSIRERAVVFETLKRAYLRTSPAAGRAPYIVPIVLATWREKPSCTGCGPVTLSTFVPAVPSVVRAQ